MSISQTMVARTHLMFLMVSLSVPSQSALLAEEPRLNLNDFEWTVGETRSQSSVEREQPLCISVAGGKNVEFKSEGKPFSIIGLTVKAKRDGIVTLIPEFFVLQDGISYGVCQGIRIVKPVRDTRAEAFFPPNNAFVEVGHAGSRLPCKKGDTVVIALLFRHIVTENAELLATVPVVPIRKAPQIKVDAQRTLPADADGPRR